MLHWLLDTLLVIALAVAAYFVLGLPQSAMGQGPCMQVSMLQVMAAVVGNADLRTVPADKIEPVLALFNAMPPITDDRWSILMLMDDAAYGGGMLMMGHAGTICRMQPFDADEWEHLIEIIYGRRA